MVLCEPGVGGWLKGRWNVITIMTVFPRVLSRFDGRRHGKSAVPATKGWRWHVVGLARKERRKALVA